MRDSEKKIHQQIKCYLSRLLSNPQDIEDLTQESFLKVLEAGKKGDIPFPKAYIYKTSRNLALNFLQKKSTKQAVSIEDCGSQDVLSSKQNLEEIIEEKQRFQLFCEAATELPDQCRRVFILRKVYGLSQQEVARRLGISQSTVEKHIAKAMLRCSDYMDSRGYPLR